MENTSFIVAGVTHSDAAHGYYTSYSPHRKPVLADNVITYFVIRHFQDLCLLSVTLRPVLIISDCSREQADLKHGEGLKEK